MRLKKIVTVPGLVDDLQLLLVDKNKGLRHILRLLVKILLYILRF